MNSSDHEHVHYNAIQGEDKKENLEQMSREVSCAMLCLLVCSSVQCSLTSLRS